jgi:hypothetical protein
MSATHGHIGDMLDGLSGKVHTFFCGLGGHDLLLNLEPTRLSLKCSSCPYETPGWLVKEAAEKPPLHQSAMVLQTHTH